MVQLGIMEGFSGQDLVRFGEVMRKLGAAYGKPVDQEMLAAYEMALCDVSIEDIEGNAIRHLRTSQWMPRPVDLRRRSYRQQWIDGVKRQRVQRLEDRTRRDYWRINPPPKRLSQLVPNGICEVCGESVVGTDCGCF